MGRLICWTSAQALFLFHPDQQTEKSIVVVNTVEFLHPYLSQPFLTSKDIIVHALDIITSEIKQSPPTRYNAQLQSIDDMQQLVPAWASGSKRNTSLFPMLWVTGSRPQFRKPKNFQKGRLLMFSPTRSSEFSRCLEMVIGVFWYRRTRSLVSQVR